MKKVYIEKFRNFAEKTLKGYRDYDLDKRELASLMNRDIKRFYENEVTTISMRKDENDKLNHILTVTYAFYIVMLETRNRIWAYDFMSFSRRIGELWEPFCKLAFYYPKKNLNLISPPKFDIVQKQLESNTFAFIESLDISSIQKKKLKELYSTPWSMVDSGSVKLDLDLHFSQNNYNYNCDFKSGFSSNEKGNTNRLLLVASIYKLIGDNEKNIIFVRQNEAENNHYLQTLKKSSQWEVYCADECYKKIKCFTGADLRSWLDNNATWERDLSKEFLKHLRDNELLKYLTW